MAACLEWTKTLVTYQWALLHGVNADLCNPHSFQGKIHCCRGSTFYCPLHSSHTRPASFVFQKSLSTTMIFRFAVATRSQSKITVQAVKLDIVQSYCSALLVLFVLFFTVLSKISIAAIYKKVERITSAKLIGYRLCIFRGIWFPVYIKWQHNAQ